MDLNGAALASWAYYATNSGVQVASGVLQDGRNDLSVAAIDTNGFEVGDDVTVWTGSRNLLVTVVDRSNMPIAWATVIATLDDDSSVTAWGYTDSAGRIVVTSLPSAYAVQLQVDTYDNWNGWYRPKTLLTAPGVTGATFQLDVNNNDLSGGLNGWTRNVQNNANVNVELHSETSIPRRLLSANVRSPRRGGGIRKWRDFCDLVGLRSHR